MRQTLNPGELPIHDNAALCVENLRHNLLLRRQREGAGYLLEAEAEWVLARVSVYPMIREINVELPDGDDVDDEDEVFDVETPEDEIGEGCRYGAE